MTMMLRLVAFVVAIALLVAAVLTPSDAEAKGTSYLLTGGDLGMSGALLSGFIPDDDGTDWSATVECQNVSPPTTMPSVAYELYLRFGVFAVPSQRVHGPEMRYYPELRLVHHVWSDQWCDPPAPAIAYLDAAIADALAAKARGELDDAFVADLTDRRMHEVHYWLRPYASIGTAETYSPPYLGQCDECTAYVPDSQEFVLRHLVQTMRATPRRFADRPERPAYAIEFEGFFPEGWGIGGLLGLYTPPRDGEPGRFWISGLFDGEKLEYYETTPGFDAAVAQVLSPRPNRERIEPAILDVGRDGGGAPISSVAGAGVALALAALLAVGAVRYRPI